MNDAIPKEQKWLNMILIKAGQAIIPSIKGGVNIDLFDAASVLKYKDKSGYYPQDRLNSDDDSTAQMLALLDIIMDLSSTDLLFCDEETENEGQRFEDYKIAVYDFTCSALVHIQKNNPLLNNHFLETPHIATFVDEHNAIMDDFNSGTIDFYSAKTSLDGWRDGVPQAVLQYGYLMLVYSHIKKLLDKAKLSA